jgi:hypothetical protein
VEVVDDRAGDVALLAVEDEIVAVFDCDRF